MAAHDHLDTPLAKVCRILGGQSALAKLVGLHQTTVSERVRKKLPIWPEKVLLIESETGISRHDLRPDLYPREETGPAQHPVGHPSAGMASPRNLADGSSGSLEGAPA